MLLVPLLGLVSCTTSKKNESTNNSGYSTPEAEGISSEAILKFVEALEASQPDAIHSVMIRRHGKIVAEGWWAPYGPDTPHLLWSLSKSFTSTAIGMAQDEGLLNINDQVISFFPEDTPEEPSENLKAMRIRDLLKMNSGHQWGTSGGMMQGENWVKGFLAQEVQHKPGTHFVYNSGATYMLSAILQKVSGGPMLDFLTPRLFVPLGIENPTWESDPEGINVGGWGLSVTTEDISKLGQLYLQKGVWEGKQLISEAWVKEATGYQTSNGSSPDSDWEQGYGYQFWQCRHNAYRGDGAFGQYCIVMPEQDVVLAITSGSDDMQGIMNVAWDYLLPAMEKAPLPPNEEGVKQMNQKLKALAISKAKGDQNSSMASEVAGLTYIMEPNNRSLESISFNFEASPIEITITAHEEEYSFKAGYQNNELGLLPNPPMVSQKVAVSGAWEDANTYTSHINYYETPQSIRMTFQFKGKKLTWDTENKASFGPKNLPQLVGTAQ